MLTSSYSQHEKSAYVPTLWYQITKHICSLVGMRVNQKVLFVNYALVRSGRRKDIKIASKKDARNTFLGLTLLCYRKTIVNAYAVISIKAFHCINQ